MADDEKVKVTLNLPKSLVKQAKHRALDEERDLQDLVMEALRAFLGKKERGR